MVMHFEWNEKKRAENLAKHQVDLLDAALMFEGSFVTYDDDRFDYGERRSISMGYVDGQLYVLVHTDRDGTTRLISARKGGRHDRRKYQAGNPARNSTDEGEG